MLLNNNQGSFGMFSRAGRNSTEKFHILVRKDEILSGINNKIKPKDIFTPDDYVKQNDEDEDDIDLFKITENETKKTDPKKREKIEINNKQKKQKKKPTQRSFSNEIKSRLPKLNLKSNDVGSINYNPNKKFVWKRIITGPEWCASLRKNFSKIKKEEDDKKFYTTHIDYTKINSRNFIDMTRQTKRTSFVKDLKEKDKPDSVIINKLNTSSYNTDKDNSLEKKKNPQNFNKWVKIQAPDFRKTISRDQLEKIHEDKRTVIPFSLPNTALTTSRPIMMVKYDTNTYNNKKFDSRPRSTEYIPNLNYDPHKVLDKINNFKKPTSPNFNLMTSRPNDEGDPLPSYMKRIYSRQATEMLTDKALKLNNFSEGKFSSSETSFWPKKSFNKIINLNLLNSTKFKDNLGFKTINGTKNDNVYKSIKFYNKNYDDLMKECLLNKFDNVTFKTIKRENKFQTNDLEKFLINFDKLNV